MKRTREGRLLRLTLDRVDKRNALDSVTCRDLVAAFAEAEMDRGVGATLLDAEGPVFCAGMDLDESLLPDAAERNAIHAQLFTVGLESHKPVVAFVQGPAIAGGVGLVANAHIVVASETSTFSLPEIRIGMWPFVIWRSLVAAIGERRAMELSLTARTIDAAEAVLYGLVHRVGTADDAHQIAARLAGSSAEAVRRGLTLAHDSRHMTADEAVKLAGSLRGRMFRSEDYREGVRAFREKRRPRWPSLEREVRNEGE